MEDLARRQLNALLKAARRVPTLAKKGPKGPWTAGVALLPSAPMRALNKRYRRKDRPTDVLSFPSPRDFRSRSGYLGDLAICVPVLRRQAREQGHAETRELRVLLVHGLLHLLGFDHEKGPRQAREMGRWEAVLLGRGATRGGLVARSGT